MQIVLQEQQEMGNGRLRREIERQEGFLEVRGMSQTNKWGSVR